MDAEHQRVSRTAGGWPRASARPRRTLGLLCATLAPLLSGCGPNVECSGKDVQAALGRALDDLYAQSRQLATVDLTITDIVAVREGPKSAACKVLLQLDADLFGRKYSQPVTFPYTAEVTEGGKIFVTITDTSKK